MEFLIALGILIVFLVLGLPVLFAFAAAALFLLIYSGMDPSFFMSTGYANLGSMVMVVMPLFILSGQIMAKGRMGSALVDLISKFVGRARAALSSVGIITCAVFGALTGSGAATLTCIGTIMAPRMKEKHYPAGNVAAIFANAAPLGMLIPPSGLMIVFAWCTQQSVLGCFLATVGPGIMLTLLLCVVNYFLLRNNKEIEREPKMERTEWVADLGQRARMGIPALLFPVIVLGGVYGGIMTVTESAAVGCVYAFIVSLLFYKAFTLKESKKIFVDSATSIGVIMVTIFITTVLSQILIRMGMPQTVKTFLLSLTSNETLLLLLVNIFLIFIGMLMDDTSGMMLCAPMLFPLMMELGVNPLHYAAIMGVNLGMANVTPPSAPFLYMACRTVGCSLKDMLKPTLFMLLFAWLPTLLVTTFIPGVSLFLPRLAGF